MTRPPQEFGARTLLEEVKIGKRVSDSEAKVLLGAARGESAQETADHGYLAYETIKSHRKNVIAKLGARNLTNAVVIGIATGILNIDRIVEVDDQ